MSIILHSKIGDPAPREFLASLSSSSTVGFAGSRHLELCSGFCIKLVCQLDKKAGHFAVGCAKGVDATFHFALTFFFHEKSSFFRAFHERLHLGLPVAFTSPPHLPLAVALATRTRHFVQACTHIVLFPDTWGPGSKLCFRLCKKLGVSVLVVT
jgi:hypothetical protein